MMLRRFAVSLAPVLGLLTFTLAFAQPPRPGESRERLGRDAARESLRFFESRIRPVLIEHCYDCHSGAAAEAAGGLLVDSRAGLLRGGESGPAIVAGKPESSLLLTAIRHAERKLAMPPPDAGEKLPPAVIADFETWIRRGAFDPRVEENAAPTTDSAARQWWAWQGLSESEPPDEPTGRFTDPIDRFWYAALASVGIEPNAPADRATLVRRLAFDLTGLPPTPEEFHEFVTSASPQPIADLVDRYLESPEFGVRFARHWLDVARYAESSGNDANIAFPHAWRYRDYVIDAFNDDLPFDRFVREQLAGDRLPSDSDEQRARQVIATGFLAVGPKSLNENNPHQFALDLADEQVDTLSQAFLGVTISCARCHDHKFDPVSHRDYTALAGIFLSSQTLYGTPGSIGGRNRGRLFELLADDSLGNGQPAVDARMIERLGRQLDDLRRQRDEMQRELLAARRTGEGRDVRAGLNLALLNSRIATLELQLDSRFEDGMPKPLAMAVVDKASPSRGGPFRERFGRGFGGNLPNGGNRPGMAMNERPSMEMSQPALPAAGLGGRFRQPFDLRFLLDSPQFIRGELERPGDPIARGLPEFLAAGHDEISIPGNTSGRLELANWIASDSNPLTARVITNRVWSWMFGRGLVASVDNFGTTGDPPSHPELLDYLSAQFIRDGWSIKSLVRRLALTHAYALASDIDAEKQQLDPDNRLIWRANLKPIEAECLRDAMLAAAGQLDPVRPAGSLVSQNGDGLIGGRNRQGGLSEERIAAADGSFRSLYLPLPRQVLPDVLHLFDMADNSLVTGSRETTLVPSQALYWLNSPRVEQLAAATARRVLGDAAGPSAEAFARRGFGGGFLGGQRFAPADPTARPANPRLQSGVRRDAMPQGRFQPPRERFVARDVARDQATIETRLRETTILLLGREPLADELAATFDFVTARADQGSTELDIWTAVCKSLISSGDFRFLR